MRSLRPCSDSSATHSFPSQPEGKIWLPRANPRATGSLASQRHPGKFPKVPGRAFPLGWPWEAKSSPRVARESWGLRSSHRRAEETSPRSNIAASTQESGWFASLCTKGIAIIQPPSLIIRNEEWASHWRAGSKLPIFDKDDEFHKAFFPAGGAQITLTPCPPFSSVEPGDVPVDLALGRWGPQLPCSSTPFWAQCPSP